MRQSKIYKLYLQKMRESLNNTPVEAKVLVKCLEDITGNKHPNS